MIIFIFGSDDYRILEKLKEIVEKYKKHSKDVVSFKFFDCENDDFQAFREAFFSAGMFKEKKVLILKNLFSNKNFKEKFYLEKEKFVNSSNVLLIIEKKENNEKDQLFKFLLSTSKWYKIEPPEGEALTTWAKKEFLKFGTKIEQKALEELITFTGNDLWRLNNEIKKLVAFKKGKKILFQDVNLLVCRATETQVFRTIENLANGKKEITFKFLQQHLVGGESPLYLLAMITFQFRILLQIKDLIEKKFSYYSILKKTNLSPLIFKKNYYLSQKFTLDKLKRIYENIFKFEMAAKTGKVDPETALSLLVCEV